MQVQAKISTLTQKYYFIYQSSLLAPSAKISVDWRAKDVPAMGFRMDSEIASLTLRALRRVLRATEIGSRQLATTTGLTPSQLLVLREIDAREKATPSGIAQALQFSQATITTIVDRLEALGFVQRQRGEKDKRRFMLTALPAGRAAIAAAPDSLQMTFTGRFIELPTWEQAMILSAVEKLATLMGAQEIDAAPLLDSGLIDRSTPD